MDNGNTPFAVYLDLSKAFDTLNQFYRTNLNFTVLEEFTSINLIKQGFNKGQY